MADNWNLASIEPLDDTNYFLWSEKVEGILRSKKLWKKVIGVRPLKKPEEGEANYEEKLRKWNEWDDNNYAARTVMVNTMNKAQILKYSREKSADKLWSLIKQNMAAETEELKARSLNELSNLRMKKDENIDAFVNRAEALRNQCIQLGKNIEDYELRMYILRGLRQEFDQNVRVLETQKNLTINDIRFALKQEELRREKRREEKSSRDQENVRRVKDKQRNDVHCFNCGMKGHIAGECYNKQRCFNCQGFNHVAAACREPKRNAYSRGRGYRGNVQGNFRGRAAVRGYGRSEVTLKTTDESVLKVSEKSNESTALATNDKEVYINDCDKSQTWLLDSGATSHMTYKEKIFDKFEEEERQISLADKEGKKLFSKGIGEVVMKQSSNINKLRLKNVLCVPELNTNLLSVAKITDNGYNVKFNKYGAIVYKESNEIEMTAVRVGNAYYARSFIMNEEAATMTEDMDIWHKRLGHANKKIIDEIKKEDLVIGMRNNNINIQCEPCVEGKSRKKSHYRLENRRTSEILELWHMDLIGPIKPSSRGRKNYILTIIDDYSRVIFIQLLQEKRDAAEELKKLIVLKENQSGLKLKAIRSDNGGEFIGRNLKEWLEKKGIKHELSPPRTPQCNGVVERANKSIIETTRAMMSDSKMPLDFWAEAVCTAVHIRNRIKSRVHGKTPYEMWNKRKPNVEHIRRFGCIAYLLDKGGTKKKFASKTTKGIFVGYAANNTYRVYIPEIGKIRCDCDVKFDENKNGCELFYNRKQENQINNKNLIVIGLKYEDEDEEVEPVYENNEEDRNEESEEENSEYEDATMTNSDNEDDDQGDYENENNDNQNQEVVEMPEDLIEIRHRGRPRGVTKEVMQMRNDLEREEEEERYREMGVRRSERIRHQQAMRITDKEIPKTVQEAKRSDDWKHWKQAMNDEMTSMKKHDVWDLVSRPKNKKVIKCKWVFNIKNISDTQQKYKARLVAMGCGQRPGFDYEETFAPTVRAETIRLLFSISAETKRKIKIYDVKTAFLHGILKEETYMELPAGYENNLNQVCKLKKSIYGLKQASRCWNEFLIEVFLKSGLKQSKEDPCLFFVKEGNDFLFCGVHVDDMPTVSSTEEFERKYIEKIKKHIDLKDLGQAETILGMQVEQKKEKIYVHQKRYIKNLLELYGMSDCNIVSSPMDINQKLDEDDGSEMYDITSYQELMGRLIYLSVSTRPDISFALSCLSQFNQKAKKMHMNALKRILRYLKGTIHYCLEFGSKDSMKGIECETDASWDRTKDAKSFSGLLTYRNGDLIHWRSKKQSTVALSSTESEMEAMLEGLKEVIWSSKLLEEIGVSKDITKEMRCDNLNAVRLANGGNFKTKSKLLNRKCHYIREAVKEQKILVKHVSGELMTADCLTKPLSGLTLLKNVKRFMNTVSR